MKIKNLLALLSLACVLLFASCKQEQSNAIPDHLKVIPSSSTFVLSINAKDIVDKGDLDKFKNLNLYKLAKEELADRDAKAFKFMESFLSNTRSSGLNLDQIYMFMQQLGEYQSLVAFTFGVSNSSKLEKWLNEAKKVNNEFEEAEIIKGEGFHKFRMDRSTLLIWDDTKALLLMISEYDEDRYPSPESLLTIDDEHSIVADTNFMASYNNRKDVTMWFSIEKIANRSWEMREVREQLPALYEYLEDVRNASFDISLAFEKGEATMSMSVWPADFIEKYNAKYPILKTDFDESLYTYFPDKNYFVAKFSLNIQEYYKMLVDAFDKIVEGQEWDENEYQNMEKAAAILKSDSIANIVNIFKGDVLGSITGFQDGAIPIPYFAVGLTVNGEESFEQLAALIQQGLGIELQKQGSYYAYPIEEDMNIYFAYKDDIVYITNQETARESFYKQGFENNISSSDISSQLKNSILYYYLNLNFNNYPATISATVNSAAAYSGYGMFSNVLSKLSDLSLTYQGGNTYNLTLKLKDNDENILKTIVKVIDEFAKTALQSRSF